MGVGEVTVFLVRLWRNRGGAFRATARRVDREESLLFEQPQALAAYLDEQTQAQGLKDERPP